MPVKRRSVNRYFPRDLSRFFLWFRQCDRQIRGDGRFKNGKIAALEFVPACICPKGSSHFGSTPLGQTPKRSLNEVLSSKAESKALKKDSRSCPDR
jgi:hypothetical protein